MDADDLELFERSLRAAVESASADDRLADGSAAALDTAIAELGWSAALADDPRAAVATLFSLQGEHAAASSALASLMAVTLELPGEPTFVLPAFASADPPGRIDGIDGLVLGSPADAFLVVCSTGDSLVARSVPAGAAETRAVVGIDPWLGLLQVTAASASSANGASLDPERWAAALARGRLAVAHELVGASRTMLRLAREHALERIQFGVPISSFQAVRHRLAETLVAIESADAVIDAAWIDGTPATATMAKAMAGRQARVVARHCQQVLAGIGFTTEHDLHRFIRRAYALDGLLGTSVALTKAMGDDLLATRELPPLLPL